ncbi:Hypothetical protein ORPV_564 [Orpheovirus IHUMI-LCC2]|uniref:Uncharacterized protein n=1 Tax=Orpheovirus IHUMI-LCC2 TaxID=2023057 RepID=A0A2I2L4K6_9VIRU|nr:Hypothetical protein ORPV_564 [Orpheovirus IHUMI-LCC2]SNW62468.1 Hypothetical protein ORPV_564 [Orpheovirus IHUMI-LCC2]
MSTSEKAILHQHLIKESIPLPFYTYIPDGSKWRSIMTLHDGTKFYSSTNASKRGADKETVASALKYYDITSDNEIDDRRLNISKGSDSDSDGPDDKNAERKREISKKMDLERKGKVFAFVDIENKPIIDKLVTELFGRYNTDDIIIYGFLYGESGLYNKYENFRHKNIKILPVEGKLDKSKDAADIYMILYIGHLLGKGSLDDKEIYICTGDHFGTTLCHLINNGFYGMVGRQCKVLTSYEELEKYLLNGCSLSYTP